MAPAQIIDLQRHRRWADPSADALKAAIDSGRVRHIMSLRGDLHAPGEAPAESAREEPSPSVLAHRP